jgi:uncharacterized cupin superfamily protein
MHSHHFQEEVFTVVRGRLGYQLQGGEPRYAESGETVVFPAGVAHKFWNAGSDVLECSAHVMPADNIEYFLTAVFDAQKRGRNGRPELFDAAWLARRYRSEYTMHEIPAVVQKVIMPLVVLVGTVLGKDRKFADAAAPRLR